MYPRTVFTLEQESPGLQPEADSGVGAGIQTYVGFRDPSNNWVITAEDTLFSSEIWAV